MRPDLDEYEEMNPDLAAAPRSRAMSWLVLGVAVIGFGALAYYAYRSGSQTVGDGQMLTVQAEPGAIKETPVDAGGEQFPHQDKTIYDALSSTHPDNKTETLLPNAEEPVIPEPAVGANDENSNKTTSYVNKEAAGDEGTVDEADSDDYVSTPAPTAAPVKAEPAPAATPASAPAKAEPAKTAVAPATPLPPLATTPAKTEAVPAPAKTETVAASKVEEKPAAKPVAKTETAKPKAMGGSYKVQLGAFSSDAEARANWKKISGKNSDVLSGDPIVVKADVNGKTFYRLRASGFASADAAKKACATLSGRGQACFPAGK